MLARISWVENKSAVLQHYSLRPKERLGTAIRQHATKSIQSGSGETLADDSTPATSSSYARAPHIKKPNIQIDPFKDDTTLFISGLEKGNYVHSAIENERIMFEK